MSIASQVTGLILAGGAGRRVGSRDKGLLLWRNRPLIEHVCTRLGPQVDRLLISCNRNPDQYARYAENIVADTQPGYSGPLAGLEAAAPLIETDFVALACCDTPLLPHDLVMRLSTPMRSQENGSVDICYAHDGHRAQYLSAVVRRSCLDTLPGAIEAGQRAVRDWYALHVTVQVDFADRGECFRNFNDLSELRIPG